MTSWIVAIANTHPQHWDIAASRGFWDMTRRVDIQRGDTVYFWLTKGSLVSKTTATSDAAPITEADALPLEDSGVRSYTTRFHLCGYLGPATCAAHWTVVASSSGARAGLNFGPQRIDVRTRLPCWRRRRHHRSSGSRRLYLLRCSRASRPRCCTRCPQTSENRRL